ncbi:MAG: ethanolamine ammonia-lyase reactivating factor EutA [Beijerinckiaceae bacterium]|nr:ethanolamine ammonia-lyase reactivating factor EutA [Beijerinckiaceae bacterium]
MHDLDEAHDHAGMSEEDKAAMAAWIWSQETVELKTIGIDIGSSTSHLLFAKVTLQRQSQGLSSRFLVTRRDVLWRSPIMLTPFLPNGTIDARSLEDFIRGAYAAAGFRREDVDTGAVILTGEAIKRTNARAIDELFAEEAGKFVCATAGHKLECTLAAHGSGAVALSKAQDAVVLHIDIGGGTTKLSLIDRGVIRSVAAFAVGGRLLAHDGREGWTRVDESAQLVADELGLSTTPGALSNLMTRKKIAERLADIAVDQITGAKLDALGQKLELTEPLDRSLTPTILTFSGGVSEYIFGTEEAQYGDIAKLLAAAIRTKLAARSSLPISDPGNRIRATVIGASQFTVQVSGKTIYLPPDGSLPVHNVPVIQVGMDLSDDIAPEVVTKRILEKIAQLDLEPSDRMAIAFPWHGDPEYSRLASAARAIRDAVAPEGRRKNLLLMMIDGDVGRTMGRLLSDEVGLDGPLVSIDGVQLQELDYVDVGELISPPGVVPVVIKSLLFS